MPPPVKIFCASGRTSPAPDPYGVTRKACPNDRKKPTGGMPGAYVVIRADRGAITIADQGSSSATFGSRKILKVLTAYS